MYELCDGKVWRAVEAMIDGIQAQDQRSDFKIDMHTFGDVKSGICFGCAATCAVQQLAGVNLTATNIHDRHETLNIDMNDMLAFEHAINVLRLGALGILFGYFKKERSLVGFRHLPVLHTFNWREGLTHYRTLLTALKEFDI